MQFGVYPVDENREVIKAQMDEILEKYKKDQDDPLVLLAVADATIQYFNRFNEGDIDRAIFASRKAWKLSPMLYEAIFWEALSHETAGRFNKAEEKYTKFINVAKKTKRCNLFVKKAEKFLKTNKY